MDTKYVGREKEYRHEQYLANKEKVLQRSKENYEANKEKISERRKKWRNDNPDKAWRRTLKYRFNITVEQYEELLKKQNGVCAICKRDSDDGKRLSVDHDHNCCPNRQSCGNCIRGLLCRNCNTKLGWFDIYSLEINNYLGD